MPFQKVDVFRKYDTKDGFREKHVQSRSSAKTLSKDLFKDSLIKHQPNSRSLAFCGGAHSNSGAITPKRGGYEFYSTYIIYNKIYNKKMFACVHIYLGT